MNQLYIYIYPHISSLLHLPPPPPPYTTPLGGHKAPSWSPCAMQLLPTSYLFYIWKCIYVHATLSLRPSLPFPSPYPQVHSLVGQILNGWSLQYSVENNRRISNHQTNLMRRKTTCLSSSIIIHYYLISFICSVQCSDNSGILPCSCYFSVRWNFEEQGTISLALIHKK